MSWLDSLLPADHPLAGCQAKFARAHEHFNTLQDEVTAYYAPREGEVQFGRFRAEPHPRAENLFRYVVAEVPDPPLRFATTIGDIVHNLRSALDHLAFELAFLGERGKVIPEKVAYPCSLTRANWRGRHVQHTLLAGVMAKHRADIYRTQPCYRKKDPPTSPRTLARRKPHPLADLEKLWNHDKHRMLQPVAIALNTMQATVVQTRDCEVTGNPRFSMGVFGRPFEPETEFLTVAIRKTGPDPYVYVQFEGEGDIAFRNGIPARQALAGIGTAVEGILAHFQPEFETKAARRLWGVSRQGWIETTPRLRRTWRSP